MAVVLLFYINWKKLAELPDLKKKIITAENVRPVL
jgi:hypothetical protein